MLLCSNRATGLKICEIIKDFFCTNKKNTIVYVPSFDFPILCKNLICPFW